MSKGIQRVAVVIPAKDEEEHIAQTVRAARAIPFVDLILVVDDGSQDRTQHVARSAGAVVVRHSVNRGKASAMETGAAVAAMRDTPGGPPRLLLFLDGDLGESAVEAANLVIPVREGKTDCAIAVLPPRAGAGGHGLVTGLARRAICSLTGFNAHQPLSGQRCLTRDAFDAASPLANGWGVEAGMTIDLLVLGYSITEIECAISHRATSNNVRGYVHRARQYKDVFLAVNGRRLRGVRVPSAERKPEKNVLGEPYRAHITQRQSLRALAAQQPDLAALPEGDEPDTQA